MKHHTITVGVLGPWSLATSKAFWERFALSALTAQGQTQQLRSVFRTEGDWRRAGCR